jgi:Pectate lyase superfamily protein
MKKLSVFVLLAALTTTVTAQTSDLWGVNGERWNPRSRLPDFSFAGYHSGEAELPKVPRGVSVKDLGAKGDGETDDTAAFLKALATVKSGAIEVPAGRYRINDILEIKRSHVVLRGEGPDKSVLFFPKQLNDIKPNWGATTAGRPTSNYSWSGGFVWLKGNTGGHTLATITEPARRGDSTLRVSKSEDLRVGQRVEIRETDTPENTLADLLYTGDAGDTSKLLGSTRASIVCHIRNLKGDEIELDRPLRFDIKSEWQPRVVSFEPTVSESGVENLGFEFPVTPYAGHFTELGFNAVAFNGVSDCWARNLRIANADSGIFTNCYFSTISGVIFESARTPDKSGNTGHHGFNFEGEDTLFTDFDFRTQFIHDITLDHNASGNVSAHGKGIDLSFDHHRRAVNENLFTDIDAGAGTHLWLSSGGDALGKHAAARNTFWNIRARRPQNYPPTDFGPVSINLIAVETQQPSEKNLNGRWLEAIPPNKIIPQDIHIAQLARRLRRSR